ncbi:LOW QUALITY PROTEIN: hypothetical protein BDA96_04G168400 [Sorghum bicolor]|uniref:Uncharacterized protein n=1 Tax=Sorghum bicolor TaxID=4558 RepID=A0A921UI96_SORBI|nr:LOW QUALITY PROTEIN: hypothetical protein BDA96_04G168400 [Sorghum bicolor]
MPQPHIMVVPYPGSGNINPALQLALLLCYHGIFITFVVTGHNLRRAQAAATEGAVSSCDDAFRIETIPDGLVFADPNDDRAFAEELAELWATTACVPDDVLVCLVGNMVTEEALPTMFNRTDGVGDDTGTSAFPWARWIRGWTAEENRMLSKICGVVAGDERRHEAAYTKASSELFGVDPDGMVRALAYVMLRKKLSVAKGGGGDDEAGCPAPAPGPAEQEAEEGRRPEGPARSAISRVAPHAVGLELDAKYEAGASRSAATGRQLVMIGGLLLLRAAAAREAAAAVLALAVAEEARARRAPAGPGPTETGAPPSISLVEEVAEPLDPTRPRSSISHDWKGKKDIILPGAYVSDPLNGRKQTE